MEIKTLAHLSEIELCDITNCCFQDYAIPCTCTPDTFYRNNVRRQVNYNISVGAFDDNKCVGLILVGDGFWNNQKAAYDAGTAVLPSYRRQGISKKMLSFLCEQLKAQNYRLFLLEVLSNNNAAIKLYQSFGFKITRTLDCYQGKLDPQLLKPPPPAEAFYFQNLDTTNDNVLPTFWDTQPSWQNSSKSIDSLEEPHLLLGAFSRLNKELFGYVAARSAPKSVEIIQLAVSKAHRRQGYGSALLKKACSGSNNDAVINIINVDSNNLSLNCFLKNRAGLAITHSQLEMSLEF